ncbi:MAG: DUF6391 domain-containing protein [Caldilineales bacterium]
MNLPALSPVRRTRQNHALEHATITLLMARMTHSALVGGRSTSRGFYIVGPVETELLTRTATEALLRLQGGEGELAIHPNCGTNLVTTGTLSGLAALGATALARARRAGLFDRIAAGVLAAMAAVVVSRPLGMHLQRSVTTLADVQGVQIGSISRHQLGKLVIHWVRTVKDEG